MSWGSSSRLVLRIKRPTRVTRRSFLLTCFVALGVRVLGIDRAEFINLDELVVESVAPLLEENRTFAVEFDGKGDREHDRRSADERKRTDDLVEQPFHHDVPIRDRAVEDIDHRNVADIGIGARAEPEPVGVRRQADIDRQHPQLLEHMKNTAFGRDRQRKDYEIDPGFAGKLDDVVDDAEIGHAIANRQASAVVAVVKHADHVQIGIALRGKRLQQRFAVFVGTDDDGAAIKPALARPVPHHQEQSTAKSDKDNQPEHVKSAEPHARKLVAGFGEERYSDHDQEYD